MKYATVIARNDKTRKLLEYILVVNEGWAVIQPINFPSTDVKLGDDSHEFKVNVENATHNRICEANAVFIVVDNLEEGIPKYMEKYILTAQINHKEVHIRYIAPSELTRLEKVWEE